MTKTITLLCSAFMAYSTSIHALSKQHDDLSTYIIHSPKAHLSLHIEGTLTPDLYWDLANRNHIQTPYHSKKQVKEKIKSLTHLDDFLNLDHLHIQVLKNKRDFYDLTKNMLNSQYQQGVSHLEFQFNPENHMARGVPLQEIIEGMTLAITDFQQQHKMSVFIIASFLKEPPIEETIASYQQLLATSRQYPKFQHLWKAVGLDSNEKGNPPSKFYPFIELARKHGHKIVPHGGHDEPAKPYISEYLLTCSTIDRLDHGNMAAFDQEVLIKLHKCKMPVALCPISEIKIGPMLSLSRYPLKTFLKHHILVSLNADDPAYLNANLVDNYRELAISQHLNKNELKQLFINSFKGSLLNKDEKSYWISQLNRKEPRLKNNLITIM